MSVVSSSSSSKSKSTTQGTGGGNNNNVGVIVGVVVAVVVVVIALAMIAIGVVVPVSEEEQRSPGIGGDIALQSNKFQEEPTNLFRAKHCFSVLRHLYTSNSSWSQLHSTTGHHSSAAPVVLNYNQFKLTPTQQLSVAPALFLFNINIIDCCSTADEPGTILLHPVLQCWGCPPYMTSSVSIAKTCPSTLLGVPALVLYLHVSAVTVVCNVV